MSQQTEQKKKKLSPEQIKERLAELFDYEYQVFCEIKERDGRVQELTEQVFEPVKDRIKRYAETIEERFELGEPLGILNINQISGYIRGIAREKGVSEGSIEYITKVVDPKYIDPRFTREQSNKPFVGGVNSPTEGLKYIPVGALTTKQIQDEVEKLDGDLDQINEEKRRKQERFNDLMEVVKEKKIALTIPVKTDSIRTSEGLIQDTEGWLALGEHIETLVGIRENYHERPLPTNEDKEFAQGVRDYNEVFKPYSDLKYSKSFPEWQQVQITNEHSGKHAAAVKHGTILPSGIKRNLTREQVGDSAEEILTKSYNALIAIPIIARLTSWHRKEIEPVVAQRKVDLHETLSAQA